MKKLGLIGGMGPQSTIPYYHGIVYGVQKRTAPDFFPNLTIESVNVFHILDLCAREDYDAIARYLLEAIRNLYKAGAEFAALSANTSHIVFDRLAEESPIPLLSIIDATRDEALRRGYSKAGLLGTRFTMTKRFYRDPFERAGIEIAVPEGEDFDFVDRKITEELEYGIIKPETLSRFQQIISRMKQTRGIETIILGCTELPLLLNDRNSPLPCLDTVEIHIDAIVNKILS
ncbi:MAG: amino acid racemase [Muribaculaceae bacterium]|nr:amino acid racemase [Muribaculaceae bacterium]